MSLFVVEIDPRKKSINKVEFAGESVGLGDMYSSLECEMVERLSLNGELDLWIDEEGMLNGAGDRIGSFTLGSIKLLGKGLICGVTTQGDSVPMDDETAEFVLDNLKIQW